MSEVGRAKSRVALAEKKSKRAPGAAAAAAVQEARRDLTEAKLKQFIVQTVAAAGPLNPDQRQRLQQLFNAGASA